MKTADVAIQIVNYKSKSYLEPLLESIRRDIASSKLSVEINILENASGDDLTAIGKKWQKHGVHIYISSKNIGFGAGHNLLATKTKAHYLLVLNPDLLLIAPASISQLVQRMEKTGAVAVGPRLLSPGLTPPKTNGGFDERQYVQQPWDHGSYNGFRYRARNHVQDVDWVCGAVMLMRRKDFDAIGGFDEKFFLYFEELDLCYRLHRRGGRIVYDPSIRVLHYGSASTGGRKQAKYLAQSFCRYHLKRLRYQLLPS